MKLNTQSVMTTCINDKLNNKKYPKFVPKSIMASSKFNMAVTM